MSEVEQRQLVLSMPQSHIYHTRKPLNLNMAGQRGGKTSMLGIKTGEYAINYPTLKGFIASNTYLQLTQSTLVEATKIWRQFYNMTEYDRKSNPNGLYVIDKKPPSHFKKFETYKDYNGIISFWNGHVIYIGSLDNFKAHDGKEFAYAHLDETKDTKEEAVKGVILARLSQKGLYIDNRTDEIIYDPNLSVSDIKTNYPYLSSFNPTWVHTSPATGETPQWLIQMFHLDKHERQIYDDITDKDDFYLYEDDRICACIYSTFHNEHNLPDGYIQGRLSVLSENEALKLVYGYPFSKTGGEFYTGFSRKKHVTSIQRRIGTKHVSFDFNVLPYMTALEAQIYSADRWVDIDGNKYQTYKEGAKQIKTLVVEFIKEYCLTPPDNTTSALCDEIIKTNSVDKSFEVFYYGDASGNNRIPGLGSHTNFKEIREKFSKYVFNGSDRVSKTNMGILKRRDLMNRIFEGKIPQIEVYFDESMTNTIRDFEFVKLAKDGKLKELAKDPQTGVMYQKLGHTSDVFDYLMCWLAKDYIIN